MLIDMQNLEGTEIIDDDRDVPADGRWHDLFEGGRNAYGAMRVIADDQGNLRGCYMETHLNDHSVQVLPDGDHRRTIVIRGDRRTVMLRTNLIMDRHPEWFERYEEIYQPVAVA